MAGPTTVELDQKVSMPLVGLGTWQMTGARCQAAVRAALQVGYRHLDTATMYRHARAVGRAVRDSGVPLDQVFVTVADEGHVPEQADRVWDVRGGSLRARS